MEPAKIANLVRALQVMSKELDCISSMLNDFVPPFFGEVPEVETIVNQLWVACASKPLLSKCLKSLIAEYNQKLQGG